MFRNQLATLALCAIAVAGIILSFRSEPDFPSIKMPSLPSDQYGLLVKQLLDGSLEESSAARGQLRKIGWPAMAAMVIGRAHDFHSDRGESIQSIMRELCWNTDGLSADEAEEVHNIRSVMNDPRYNVEYRDQVLMDSREKDSGVGQVTSRVQILLNSRVPFWRSDRRDSFPVSALHRIANLKKQGAWAELEWNLFCQGDISSLLQVLHQRPGDADLMIDAIRALALNEPEDHRHIPPVYSANVLILPILHAVGRDDEALALAKQLGMDHFEEQLLAQREDWTTLATFPVTHDFFNVSRFKPAAALLYLGKTAEADALIDANSKAADGVEPVGLQRQVVLLGRTELINKACMQRGDSDTLVEFLLRERRYGEAMAHHSKAGRPREGKDAWPGGSIIAGGTMALGPADGMDMQLDSRLVLALIKLNEIAAAQAELKRLKEAGAPDYWLNQANVLLGMPKETVKKEASSNLRVDDYDPRMFGENSPRLGAWGEVLWRETHDKQKTIDSAEMLLQGKMSAEEIVRLAELSKKKPSGSPPWYWYAKSMTGPASLELERIGAHELAQKYLREFIQSLSDPNQTTPKEFREIAGFYDGCQALNPQLGDEFLALLAASPANEPPLQYIAGVLARRAGNAQEGDRLIADAEMGLCGDIERRMWLAKKLSDMGEKELAKQQAQVVTRVVGPVGIELMEAHKLIAGIEQSSGHFSEALRQYRMAFYANFYDFILIPEDYEGFYQFARNSTYCEARAALENGDTKLAMRSAVDAVKMDCEGIDLALQLVEAFKQAGLLEQAKALVTENRSMLEAILKDYPKSHLHHFLIAKLDMRSGLANQQTSEHLRVARELAPTNTEYSDLR